MTNSNTAVETFITRNDNGTCDLMHRTLTYHQQIGPLVFDSHKLVVQMMIRETIRSKSNHNTSQTEFSGKETSEVIPNVTVPVLA